MKLSVVLASRNEIPMLVMTVLSAVEQIKADGLDGEVFVVDNSDPEFWEGVQVALAGQVKDKIVRLVHEDAPCISVCLDRAHREARGEFIFYTDAHTLIGHGTLKALLGFYEGREEEKIGYVHAPIQWAHSSSKGRKTHFGLNYSLLGGWGDSKAAKEPMKVTWKGMPYMIQRSTYEAIGGMGCCAEHKVGWGVMYYMGIKTWIHGFPNWAIPDGVSYHFGEWPEKARCHTRYRTYSKSGEAKPGLGIALAAYVFGGEALLRDEFVRAKMSRFFTSFEQALGLASRIGGAERQWLKDNNKPDLQDLIADAPWGEITKVVTTISPEYLQLNSDLHGNPDVLYGYKGAEQMEQVKRWAGINRCRSILDYGAGKQTLSAALRANGCKDVRDYDPAVPAISAPPAPADMVVCTDVLEHVEPEFLDKVLDHLASLTRTVAYIRICGVPCTSKTLPDGSDPHRIVQPQDWWLAKLSERFRLDRTLESSEKYFTFLMKPL